MRDAVLCVRDAVLCVRGLSGKGAQWWVKVLGANGTLLIGNC